MDTGNVIAAIIPTALFLFLILYYTVWMGSGYSPKIIRTGHTANIVGLSTKTTDESFIEDDLLLWKEFKHLKDQNIVPNKKEEHSFISIKKRPINGEKSWEYMIGRIVTNFNEIPAGFKTLEIEPNLFVAVHLQVKDEQSWGITISKLEKYLEEKWLPLSTKYEINKDSDVKSLIYHDKSNKKKTRAIIYYLAVKERVIDTKKRA